MVRGISVFLGIGLVILWIAGLSTPNTAGWLVWLDGIAALCAFAIAGATVPGVSRASRAGGPIALSLGLFALWVIGLATNVQSWLAWWTFAFACAFLLLGIAGGASRERVVSRYPTTETEEERRKRSA
jgi:hypothetical protein